MAFLFVFSFYYGLTFQLLEFCEFYLQIVVFKSLPAQDKRTYLCGLRSESHRLSEELVWIVYHHFPAWCFVEEHTVYRKRNHSCSWIRQLTLGFIFFIHICCVLYQNMLGDVTLCPMRIFEPEIQTYIILKSTFYTVLYRLHAVFISVVWVPVWFEDSLCVRKVFHIFQFLHSLAFHMIILGGGGGGVIWADDLWVQYNC